jgi:hypothetical protein
VHYSVLFTQQSIFSSDLPTVNPIVSKTDHRPWMTSRCYLTQQRGVDMKRSALINPRR